MVNIFSQTLSKNNCTLFFRSKHRQPRNYRSTRILLFILFCTFSAVLFYHIVKSQSFSGKGFSRCWIFESESHVAWPICLKVAASQKCPWIGVQFKWLCFSKQSRLSEEHAKRRSRLLPPQNYFLQQSSPWCVINYFFPLNSSWRIH